MQPEEPNNNNGDGPDKLNASVTNTRRPPPPPYTRPPPPYSLSTSEELMFNDIFREKAVALRAIMIEFLNVYPFYKFNTEFDNFLARIKHLTVNGQRTEASNNMIVDAAHLAITTASTASRSDSLYGYRCTNIYGQNPSVDQPGMSTTAGPLVVPHLVSDLANNSRGASTSRPNSTLSASSSTVIQMKHLCKWSVDKMTLDLACPVAVLKLNGTLLAGDEVTTLEETHDAGMIECQKDTNIVKTTRGLYHLSGPIIRGFSNDFYLACLENNGFPKSWRHFLIQHTSVEETNEDASNSDSSVTRNGTNYKNATHKSYEKGKLAKQNLAKHKVVMQQLSQASASKTLEHMNSCKTPSQFLKYQFHRKLVKACKIVNNQLK